MNAIFLTCLCILICLNSVLILILQQYMVPQASIFGDLSVPANAFNNYRVYGTCLFILMFISVLVGVRFVSKVSALVLFCVIVSIICIYIGLFAANTARGPE